MREIRTSGLMSGEGKRTAHAAPRPSSTLLVVVAGRRIFLRGQTGLALDGVMVGLNDAAAQARQAIENVRILLADAGADLSHAVKLVTYVTDRAYMAPVRDVIEPSFGRTPMPGTELVVKGLAAPEVLMEIDVHAVLPS